MLMQVGYLSMTDFAIGPVLGTGSFGRVSLARHNATGVMCAIKALSKSHVVKNQQVGGVSIRTLLMSSYHNELQFCILPVDVKQAKDLGLPEQSI